MGGLLQGAVLLGKVTEKLKNAVGNGGGKDNPKRHTVTGAIFSRVCWGRE